MAGELEDGTFDFSLGQDSWHKPHAIQGNQYARGVNISTRGGCAGPRSGYHELELTFEEKTLPTKKFQYFRTYRDIWQSGKFQARIAIVQGKDLYALTVISGLIWKTNLNTGRTVLLSETIRLDQFASRINWSYADKSVVLFDYPDYPVIIEGEEVTRASPDHKIGSVAAPQVPVSIMGTYNANRLFVFNGTGFTAGDPVGNVITPEAPITFTEIFTPSSPYINQQFTLPIGDAQYPITAAGFLQVLDSSTGIGSMFVATRNRIFSYPTDNPRAQWTQGKFGTVMLSHCGIVGPRAFVNVNSDLLFMSENGLHALSIGRDELKKWSQVPSSREVENYLKFNDPSLRQFAVLGYFDNYVFISANPYRVRALTRDGEPVTDYAHGGFVVLEIESLASFLAQGSPVWDGLWTGVNPMDIMTIEDRCFVFSKDGCDTIGGRNAIYEIKKNQTYDIVRTNKRLVRSLIYTREYDFKQPLVEKKEQTLWVQIQDMFGKIKLKIEKRPGHAHKFLKYAEWEHEAPSSLETVPTDEFLQGVAAHQMKQIVFGDAEEEGCSPITRDVYEVYRSNQLRLTIEGEAWGLQELKLRVMPQPFLERHDPEMCGPLPKTPLPLQFEPDWLIPEESVCP